MPKDAYYFSHDSNAKDDPKCVLLIEQLGMEGYGIFWVLIETLRDQPEYKYPLVLIPALARRYCTTAEKMKTVIMSYGLFQVENDEFFYSDSLNRRMEKWNDMSERQRQRALKRWNDSAALPRECHGNADAMPDYAKKGKERKGKESKLNNKEYIEIFSAYSSGNSELLKALTDFAEMRQSIKKPISTVHTAELITKKLDSLASDSKTKIAILEQSTISNWQGLFQLKENQKPEGGWKTL